MGAPEVIAFLSHLAVEENVATSTQNVAFNALIFLFRSVLQVELPPLDDIVRARWLARLPVVLSRPEVQTVLKELSGTHHLMASLLYGAELRVMKRTRLRVKDLDFVYGQMHHLVCTHPISTYAITPDHPCSDCEMILNK